MTIEFVGISATKPHVKRGAKYLFCLSPRSLCLFFPPLGVLRKESLGLRTVPGGSHLVVAGVVDLFLLPATCGAIQPINYAK